MVVSPMVAAPSALPKVSLPTTPMVSSSTVAAAVAAAHAADKKTPKKHPAPSSSAAADSNWFDVGIIKGTSCTVSSYYLPSGDLEKSEIDVEGDENLAKKVDLQ